MNEEQLEKYFERIKYEGNIQADLETLTKIQCRHTYTIPFENLNPLLSIPVPLDYESVFNKLVYQGRGGYCFEQNLLLKNVLESIGFEVEGLMSRAGRDEYISGRTHMILLIILNGERYIADVGYGGLVPTGPLLLHKNIIQTTPNESYRFTEFDGGYRLEVYLPEGWKRLYDFDLQKQIFKDYEVANWYTSTNPNSIFTNTLVAARTDEGKRYTLKGRQFTVRAADENIESYEVESFKEMLRILQDVFYINTSEVLNIIDLQNKLWD